MTQRVWTWLAVAGCWAAPAAYAADYAGPIFDAHLHYNVEAQQAHPNRAWSSMVCVLLERLA